MINSFGKTGSGISRYRCRGKCGRMFTLLFNTMFDRRKIPLSQWLDFLLLLFRLIHLVEYHVRTTRKLFRDSTEPAVKSRPK
ncbi:MAG: hypothetical protein LKE40_12365 [Spirochaetia bacterium]|nr:hypothetical protein [Spirochaetia bacterium]